MEIKQRQLVCLHDTRFLPYCYHCQDITPFTNVFNCVGISAVQLCFISLPVKS